MTFINLSSGPHHWSEWTLHRIHRDVYRHCPSLPVSYHQFVVLLPSWAASLSSLSCFYSTDESHWEPEKRPEPETLGPLTGLFQLISPIMLKPRWWAGGLQALTLLKLHVSPLNCNSVFLSDLSTTLKFFSSVFPFCSTLFPASVLPLLSETSCCRLVATCCNSSQMTEHEAELTSQNIFLSIFTKLIPHDTNNHKLCINTWDSWEENKFM